MSALGGAEIYIRWNVLLDTSCINKETHMEIFVNSVNEKFHLRKSLKIIDTIDTIDTVDIVST